MKNIQEGQFITKFETEKKHIRPPTGWEDGILTSPLGNLQKQCVRTEYAKCLKKLQKSIASIENELEETPGLFER